MITTLDEVICKRGERVWEIGITLDGIYRPTSSVVHGGYNDVTNPDRCWKDYDLCKEECDKLNNKISVMESTKDDLLSWEEISGKIDNNEELNDIDKFIYEYEPSGVESSRKFRELFYKALNYGE